MAASRVSIVIVNYEREGDTSACLQSLAMVGSPAFDVLLVDNGSRDGSGERTLSRLGPMWRLERVGRACGPLRREGGDRRVLAFIGSPRNLGFAGGCNLGIRHALQAGAELVLLLNNDTLVEPGFLAELVGALDRDRGAGVAGGTILYAADASRVWAHGGGHVDPLFGKTTHSGYGLRDVPGAAIPTELGYVTGCLLLIRSATIRRIGLMDESYFLYYEDVAWCARARRAGYRLLWVPGARIYHKVSAGTAKAPQLVQYHEVRSRFRYLAVEGGLFARSFGIAGLALLLVVRIVQCLIRGDKARSLALALALRDGLLMRRGPLDPVDAAALSARRGGRRGRRSRKRTSGTNASAAAQ